MKTNQWLNIHGTGIMDGESLLTKSLRPFLKNKTSPLPGQIVNKTGVDTTMRQAFGLEPLARLLESLGYTGCFFLFALLPKSAEAQTQLCRAESSLIFFFIFQLAIRKIS